MRKRFITTASLLCFVVLGCSQNGIRPMTRVGASLRRSAESRRLPSMGQRWLASLASRNGRERVELRGGVRLLSRVGVGLSSDPGLRLMKGEELEGWRVLGE